MKVQLNHPGGQKPFKLGNGYFKNGNDIIREWNKDRSHYRKFIVNQGYYLNNLNDFQPKQENLYFWGEWEGNSFFIPLKNENYSIRPNGIHKPFHSIENRDHQNTDPYIFGEYFKYCVCKQIGKMQDLPLKNSVILFGSTFPKLGKFYIDTVFVVKGFENSSKVIENNAANYSKIYREATLEQLTQYLKPPTITNNNKIYHSQTWWDNKDFFSFVPCKINEEDNGFERLYIELDNQKFGLSSYQSGKSFLPKCNLSPKELWLEVAEEALKQNFKLGIRFDEPKLFNMNT